MISASASGTLLLASLLSAVGLDLVPPRFTLLTGDTPEARRAGFVPTGATVRVAALQELRDPQLEVLWEKPLVLPVYQLPAAARVFTREKHTGAPLMAGFRSEGSAVLWTAAGRGEKGYERFPYLLHALADLGVALPFRGARTWAFFDASYRLRADPDFLARRWRQAGIAALHVAAWHYYDPDPARDRYLDALIAACHRQGVLVYAWLELPHVSDRFWDEHPAWREKTAILQDAQLDWRKLVNLADPDCARAVAGGLRRLVTRFDWDGVNLAELYFESLYGPADPQRFTPMNATVRAEFQRQAGFDPLELFRPGSARHWERDRDAWRRFADYRAGLARRLQVHWLETLRTWRPELDLVLTHVDDRLDTNMRDYLGADAAGLLPLLDRLEFTFAIEDPATLWHLGPDRYAEIARRYAPLTTRHDKLAVDINIVERYQDAYPTKKQTGGELLALVHAAVRSFARVMLYSEHSIGAADYPLLAAAAAGVTAWDGTVAEATHTSGIRWAGPAALDGRLWPVADEEYVWIPPGRHRLQPTTETSPVRILWVNADLVDARVLPGGVELEYRSGSRAAVLLDAAPARVEVDGQVVSPPLLRADRHVTLLLPAGHRRVRLLR